MNGYLDEIKGKVVSIEFGIFIILNFSCYWDGFFFIFKLDGNISFDVFIERG